MFDFPEITDELIASLPEDQRANWIELRDAKAEAAQRLLDLAAERDFHTALVLTDSKQRAQALVGWDEEYALTDDETRALLADYWSSTEAWSADVRLRDGMMRLLRRVAPLHVYDDDSLDERSLRLLPEGALTVYRGNLGEKPGTGSWTLDVEIAEFFTRMAMSPRGMFLGMWRPDGVPSIWRAEVDAVDVLGYFDDRGESECVLDAASLRDVTLIRQAVPK